MQPHVEIFDKSNGNWNYNADVNRMFLLSTCNYLNLRLKVHGVLFLNEALEYCGFDRCLDGQFVGWASDEDPPISFGGLALQHDDKDPYGFIKVEFNVHGVVLHKLVRR